MVLPDSHGVSRVPCYLGKHSRVNNISFTGVLPSVLTFSHGIQLYYSFLTLCLLTRTNQMLPLPHNSNGWRLSHYHGLASSTFARHYSRNHFLFSLPEGTEMFHFPSFPPNTLYIQVWVIRHYSNRVSPFGHPWITVWLTTPQGLSQPPTSFIGF